MDLKGQTHEILDSSGPIRNVLGPFRIWTILHGDFSTQKNQLPVVLYTGESIKNTQALFLKKRRFQGSSKGFKVDSKPTPQYLHRAPGSRFRIRKSSKFEKVQGLNEVDTELSED